MGSTLLIYQKNKTQILIGDDDSEDRSLDLIRQSTCDQIQIVNIEKTVFGFGGKMNVLAQLSQLRKVNSSCILMQICDLILSG
jgi:hypothetical protein